MEADKQKDEIFVRDCPIRNILSRISDKWSILVIFTLEQTAVMRFGELQRAIPDISQKMFGEWGIFQKAMNVWYDANYKGKQKPGTEKYEEEQKKKKLL